jgi:D-lactate dehydrogenase (cytochrome)
LDTIPPHHIYDELAGSVGKEAVSKDPQLLDSYSKDDSFAKPQSPAFVAWPRSTVDVQGIVRAALKYEVTVIAVSSGAGFRQRGDTVPSKQGSLIMDLS